MTNNKIGIGIGIPLYELCITSNVDIKLVEDKLKTDENIIFDVITANLSKSQKGDLSNFMDNILSPKQKKTLRKRDRKKMTGNPIDIKDKIK